MMKWRHGLQLLTAAVTRTSRMTAPCTTSLLTRVRRKIMVEEEEEEEEEEVEVEGEEGVEGPVRSL